MTDEARAERLERLSVDVDTRLTDLWAVVWRSDSVLLPMLEDELMREALGAMVRAAYGLGYRDALQEDSEGRRGALARANGYTHT